ncbi:MAG: ATP-binding protein [Planctomycetaceae bacterium]|jgi:hypothetical protein|nr:ATP-binding protein [Planctomycetaceae bacterium]
MSHKKISYGISDFRSIMLKNYVYVDKTKFIEQLENESNPCVFFIRPRKFGKSLFFSLLSYYYNINYADEFDKLFGNLYIGQHPTPERNSYLMLEFNFSGLDTGSIERFEKAFNFCVQQSVCSFIERYRNIFLSADEMLSDITKNNPGVASLQVIFGQIRALKHQLYVIIDEYDHFTNDLIALGNAGKQTYSDLVQSGGIVRDFYELIKIGMGNVVVSRLFMTGISPILLNDLTSGFNISNNITIDSRYNEMLGFTKNEIDFVIQQCGIEEQRVSEELLKTYYNGYMFNRNAKGNIYNPSMVLFLLEQFVKKSEHIRLIDANLGTDSKKLQNLADNERNREKLLAIINDDYCDSTVVERFSLETIHAPNNFTSLLFYLGLLTHGKTNDGLDVLRIPNLSIKATYWEQLIHIIEDTSADVLIDLTDLRTAITQLAHNGNAIPLIDYVSKNIIRNISNRDLIRFDEKYIKIILLHALLQSQYYFPLTEFEVAGGYVDIYARDVFNSNNVKYEWVFEVKYIKKADATKSKSAKKTVRKTTKKKTTKLTAAESAAIEKARQSATEQLKNYKTSSYFAEKPNLKFGYIIFIGKDEYEFKEIV